MNDQKLVDAIDQKVVESKVEKRDSINNAIVMIMAVHVMSYCMTLGYNFARNTQISMFGSILMVNSLISGFQLLKILTRNVDAAKLVRMFGMLEQYENVTLTQWLQTGDFVHNNVVHNNVLQKNILGKLQFTFVHDGQVPWKQKYVLFILVHLLSMIGHVLFWNSFWPCFLTDSIFLLISLPVMTILITSNVVYETVIYQYFVERAIYAIVYCISLAMTRIINLLVSTLTMDYVPVEHYEILKLYEHDYTFVRSRQPEGSSRGGGMTFVFFKSVLSQSLLHYLKKGKHGFYSYVIDISHRYQLGGPTQVTDMFLNKRELLDRQVKELTKMINERRWHDFVTSKTINMLFEIYDNRNTSMYAARIGNAVKELQLNILRFMTLWTFSAFAFSGYSTLIFLLLITIDIYFAYFARRYLCHQHPGAYAVASVVFGISMCSGDIPTCVGACLVVFSNELVQPFIKLIYEHDVIRRFICATKEQSIFLIIVILTVAMINLASPLVALPLMYFQFDGNIKVNERDIIGDHFLTRQQLLPSGILLMTSVLTWFSGSSATSDRWLHSSLTIIIFMTMYNTYHQIQLQSSDERSIDNGNQKLIIDSYSTKTPEFEAFYREHPTLHHHHHVNQNPEGNINSVVEPINMSPLSLPPSQIQNNSSPFTAVASRHITNICSNLSRYFN